MLDATVDMTKRLRAAFGCFPSGVTVVTLMDGDGRPTGITVNSFSSLSLSPPLLMFSVGSHQVSCRWIEMQDHFTVNVHAADQEAVAWQFARPHTDKFEGIGWREGANGLPVLDGAVAHFACRKWSMMEGGDHKIVVGEILDFDSAPHDSLIFYRGAMRPLPRDAS